MAARAPARYGPRSSISVTRKIQFARISVGTANMTRSAVRTKNERMKGVDRRRTDGSESGSVSASSAMPVNGLRNEPTTNASPRPT